MLQEFLCCPVLAPLFHTNFQQQLEAVTTFLKGPANVSAAGIVYIPDYLLMAIHSQVYWLDQRYLYTPNSPYPRTYFRRADTFSIILGQT